MRLESRDTAQQEVILDDTYPVWGEGLTRDAYGRWNRAQLQTAWGLGHLRRVALVDGNDVVASAKRYDLEARLDGRLVSVLGIGAVFTPEPRRGRGHAAALLDLMHEDACARGCAWSLLFSEIGPAYYERLGYREIPKTELTLEVIRHAGKGAPAVLVRAGETADLPWIAEMCARETEQASFALVRSPEMIAFGLTRRRLLAGLGPLGEREFEFFVTEEGMRAVAYVVISHSARGRVLEDYGDRDPTGARVGAMLQVLDPRSPVDPQMRLDGRIAGSFRPPQLEVIAERPAPEAMMIRPLGDTPATFPDPAQTIYRGLDVF
jgi:predicted N-acetyltransferase YhbS